MIWRGANDRQAQRHVDRIVEVDQLDRDQPLVVIHRDQAVGLAFEMIAKCRIGYQWTDDTIGGTRRHCRRNEVELIATEQAAFTGMGVHAHHADPRLGDAKLFTQGATKFVDYAEQALAGQRARNIRERHVHRCQRDLHARAREHHHDFATTETGREIFSVTGKRKAGTPHPGLGNRRGD